MTTRRPLYPSRPVLMAGPSSTRIDVQETAKSYATAASVIGGVAAVAAIKTGPNAFLRGVGAASIAVGIYAYLNREDLKHLAIAYGIERGSDAIADQLTEWIP